MVNCILVATVPSLYHVGMQTYNHMEVLRWVLVCIIGLLTGIVAFIIDICVKRLFQAKYKVFGSGKGLFVVCVESCLC